MLSFEDVVDGLYHGLLDRPADPGGLASHVHALESGASLADVVRGMIDSGEFRLKRPIVTGRDFLPDLTIMYPEKYIRKGNESSVFKVTSDQDFDFLESLIEQYRFYDSNDVYSPLIDLDKRITASIIKSLGAKSCIELGCFTGPVLSVLAEAGIEVCGVDVSHLAFVLAYRNIRERLRFGDLLSLSFARKFDVFCAMDVFEHLNPRKIDAYFGKVASLLEDSGFVYLNSPMFGTDDVFGTPMEQYIPEWRCEGDRTYFHYLHCDALGWPMHGHILLASPTWWENAFKRQGLVRDRSIEAVLHRILKPVFDNYSPARRSLFVLRHAAFEPDVARITTDFTTNLAPLTVELRDQVG